jgi:thiamine-monophosphate kinase
VKVKNLGEFGLIDRLNKMIADARVNKASPHLILGIGDDAAAWQGDSAIQLATVDTMVQGVHFTPDTAAWPEVGWKSLAINLSDIAAMGGLPRYALVALALPDVLDVEDITELYRGLIDCAKEYGVAIVSGNISKAPQVSITITVLGAAPDNKILRRSGAKPGDVITLTGYAGSAAAGLVMLKSKLKLKAADAKYLRNAFLHPVPRIAEGQLLIKNGIAAAIDTSDGLLADLRHICEKSRVSALVNADLLPIHDAVRRNFPDQSVAMALGGGEDYQLLFTGSMESVNKVKKAASCPFTVIGEITKGKPGQIDIKGGGVNRIAVKGYGWTHF